MISKASVEDIASLTALVNSAYRGDSSRNGWTTEADLLEGIRTDAEALTAMINNPKGVILKYENETGELDACVYLERQNEQLYLGMLTVRPTLQNSGIGKRLLQA